MSQSSVPAILTVFLATLFVAKDFALRIETNPAGTLKPSYGQVSISCILDALDSEADDVYLLEIKQNGEMPIVFLRKGRDISYGASTSNLVKAHGLIDNNVTKSFLTLTLTSPTSDDSGIYTCIMYYTDQAGLLKEHRASKNITVRNFEEVLNNLMDKVSILEGALKAAQTTKDFNIVERVTILEAQDKNQSQAMAELQNTGSNVVERMTILEDYTRNQSKQIMELNEQATYISAFSATFNGHIKPVNGEVVVFSDVVMSQGHDYDNKTGIFTAPMSGVYSFQLAINIACAGCYIDLGIKANKEIVAGDSVVAHSAYWGHASMSTVTDLNKGDQVKVVILGNNNNGPGIRGDRMSMFTGYLIKAH